MAAPQPARPSAPSNDISAWMARRQREVSNRRTKAEAAGRQVWAATTRNGQFVAAPHPRDLVALGAHSLSNPRAVPARGPNGVIAKVRPDVSPVGGGRRPSRAASTSNNPSAKEVLGGQGFVPTPGIPNLGALRQLQAQFAGIGNDLDAKNSWMAWATLAPAAVMLGLEAPAALGLGRSSRT